MKGSLLLMPVVMAGLVIWAIGVGSAESQAVPESAPLPGVDPKEYVNTKRFRMPFLIEDVGVSGVGGVNLYVTRDGGREWELVTDDTKASIPFGENRGEVHFTAKADGLYGFALVVNSLAGQSGQTAPRAGETPQITVVVDTIPPQAEFFFPIIEGDAADRRLTLCWRASDDNLADKPISLSYAAKAEGPWMDIFQGIKNSGKGIWTVPRDVPVRFYLRLQVSDKAGNTATAQTPQPVCVDFARPRGKFLGVEPIRDEQPRRDENEPPGDRR